MDDVRDERALMGRVSAMTMLLAATAGTAGALLPGSPHVRVVPFAIVQALILVMGVAGLRGWIPWARLSLAAQIAVTLAVLPLLAVAMWATGGADSYEQPLVLFPLLQITYFFELRQSIPMVAFAVATFASPVLYNSAGGHHVYPARALVLGAGAMTMIYFVRLLKRRLFDAERRQREMALTDALTGLANRRAFDQQLAAALARRDLETVLLLIDLDDFKLVNDSRGHAAGDDLLRAVAVNCLDAVRLGDTLARIGGDEFAVIAPRAGAIGARRLSADLAAAIERAGATATIAWSIHPDDGHDAEALLRAADHRLYAGKRGHGAFVPNPALLEGWEPQLAG